MVLLLLIVCLIRLFICTCILIIYPWPVCVFWQYLREIISKSSHPFWRPSQRTYRMNICLCSSMMWFFRCQMECVLWKNYYMYEKCAGIYIRNRNVYELLFSYAQKWWKRMLLFLVCSPSLMTPINRVPDSGSNCLNHIIFINTSFYN